MTVMRSPALKTIIVFLNFSVSEAVGVKRGNGVKRGLLRVQVVLLDGFETVQGQVIVRLTEHSDLPRLELFNLRSHKSKVRLAVRTAIGGVTPPQSHGVRPCRPQELCLLSCPLPV